MRHPRRLAAAVAAGLVLTVWALSGGGDDAEDAAVGDCLAATTGVRMDEDAEADASVVGCSQPAAAYAVVGRIDGENDSRSRSCETFFAADEEYFVYRGTAGDGYLLCLRRTG
ncbi:hypothetical protein Asp14428_36670 [Actinoplanes sp. NBRC 14428]|uniref:Subtilisin inhibitor-like n=1 Tax=Pseudosporangium ferrugineum TaxID=439699 RepID=A0A2T0S3V1_9ACTN|nr:porin [Pseudosporangium ferrugineum]PRY28067.1 hypothetical protein CLV70_109224 [Pseudosporangium ferrugineum]BCJ52192.1 hypothetical protein Asp14428_36670 [Actinoplanes sp. NBRC 14428]